MAPEPVGRVAASSETGSTSLRSPEPVPVSALSGNDPARVFVFGSNLGGRHGKGAALFARQHRGAIYGQAEGLQGASYAIPTKDGSLRTLPIEKVRVHAARFLTFARQHPELAFELTPIGCGLAGYRHEDIAPLFADAPPNVELPPEFKNALLGRIILAVLRDSDRSGEAMETPKGGSTEGESAGPKDIAQPSATSEVI